MLLSYSLGLTLAFAAAILVGILVFLPFKKRKKWVAGGFVSFFVALFISVGLITVNSRAYIVTGKNEYKFYMVYGSPEYTMSSGETIKINVPIQNCMIVNDTKEPLILQKMIYKISGGKIKRQRILSQQTFVIKVTSVDYLFDNAPPEAIVSESPKKESAYWLRNPDEEELKALEMMEENKNPEDKTE